MYFRYVLSVRIGDVYVFQKSFKSINQVVKVAAGFNYDNNPKFHMYITDDLTDRVISFNTLKMMIKELCL